MVSRSPGGLDPRLSIDAELAGPEPPGCFGGTGADTEAPEAEAEGIGAELGGLEYFGIFILSRMEVTERWFVSGRVDVVCILAELDGVSGGGPADSEMDAVLGTLFRRDGTSDSGCPVKEDSI